MGFREMQRVACAQCGGPSTSSCERCDKPLCGVARCAVCVGRPDLDCVSAGALDPALGCASCGHPSTAHCDRCGEPVCVGPRCPLCVHTSAVDRALERNAQWFMVGGVVGLAVASAVWPPAVFALGAFFVSGPVAYLSWRFRRGAQRRTISDGVVCKRQRLLVGR